MASAALARKKRAAATRLAHNNGVLPTELLSEVLLHLPAKELCRLRLVCRSWRTLTSEPWFAAAHSSRHPLIAGMPLCPPEVHFLDLSGNVVKLVSTEQRPPYFHNLSAAQPNQVCVSECAGEALVLDPVTGAAIVLPAGKAVTHEIMGDPYKSLVAIGRVPSTGEYKVLRVHMYASNDPNLSYDQTCDVTTIGDDPRWRAGPHPPIFVWAFSSHRAVMNGVFYFIALSSSANDMVAGDIASFDLATEEWRQVRLRGILTNDDNDKLVRLEDLCLAELDGSLVTGHLNRKDSTTDIWFLVDMEKEIWNKRYSVRCAHRLRPLGVLSDGRIILWAEGRKALLRAYDPRTNTCDDLGTTVLYYLNFCMYQGSLLC